MSDGEVIELRDQLAAAEAELASSAAALRSAERRLEIERELAGARAVDLETARVMTEAAVAAMDDADIGAAVEDLRRSKPFLFETDGAGAGRGSGGNGLDRASAMGRRSPAPDPAAALRDRAASTGDRAALLSYLRARRRG